MDEGILHQPHDKFFKSAFSLPIVVQQSLNAFLPASLLAKVDINGITPDTTSYVTKKMKAYFFRHRLERTHCRRKHKDCLPF